MIDHEVPLEQEQDGELLENGSSSIVGAQKRNVCWQRNRQHSKCELSTVYQRYRPTAVTTLYTFHLLVWDSDNGRAPCRWYKFGSEWVCWLTHRADWLLPCSGKRVPGFYMRKKRILNMMSIIASNSALGTHHGVFW